jgi:hypothetical protein
MKESRGDGFRRDRQVHQRLIGGRAGPDEASRVRFGRAATMSLQMMPVVFHPAHGCADFPKLPVPYHSPRTRQRLRILAGKGTVAIHNPDNRNPASLKGQRVKVNRQCPDSLAAVLPHRRASLQRCTTF